eukprot:466284-Pyramimonas_sp.AAC.1
MGCDVDKRSRRPCRRCRALAAQRASRRRARAPSTPSRSGAGKWWYGQRRCPSTSAGALARRCRDEFEKTLL